MLHLALFALAALQQYDDFHYPSEEPAELAGADVPECIKISPGSAELRDPVTGQTATLTEGGVAFGRWHVLSVVGDHPSFVALERNYARWGLLAFVAPALPPVLSRKSVGELAKIVQPRFNLSRDVGPSYFSDVIAGLNDVALDESLKLTADGEPTYAAAAAALAPQRDVAAIGNAADVVKFAVTHNGRVKCTSRGPDVQAGGITELQDQHAPPPNVQTIVFDPANHTSFWPRIFEHSKSGLVGGHLPVANVGSFSPSAAKGFELVAFSPVGDPHAPPAPAPQPCTFTGPYLHQYVKDNTSPPAAAPTLAEAEALCAVTLDCGGVTQQDGAFALRAGHAAIQDPKYNTTSWLLSNAAQCRSLPRIAGINYAPTVLVRMREQSGAGGAAAPLVFRCFGHSIASGRYGSRLLCYAQVLRGGQCDGRRGGRRGAADQQQRLLRAPVRAPPVLRRRVGRRHGGERAGLGATHARPGARLAAEGVGQLRWQPAELRCAPSEGSDSQSPDPARPAC